MTVGVVVGEALIEPNDLARAEGLAQRGLGLLLAPAVAVGVEQSLARGEHGALAVMVDGAAFEHEVEFPRANARQLGDVVANGRVVGQVELAAPAVGLESERDRALLVPREDRAGVAQPDVAIARANELRGLRPARRGLTLPPRRRSTRRRTRLVGASARTSEATSRRGASRSPFHSLAEAGHAVQIAFCGAHSAGIEIDVSARGALMTPYL